jgi:putative flippase GtrA
MTRTLLASDEASRGGLLAFGRQTILYAIAGSFTTVWYIGLTLLLSGPAGLSIHAAIPIGYATALILHFNLQRRFVFKRAEGFTLGTFHQTRRYLTTAGVQYTLAALSTALLPELLGVPEKVVYVCTALSLAAVTFLVMRSKVFH